jgi:Ca-activated chloride channel family protein
MKGFSFANPEYLWLLVIIPLLSVLWYFRFRRSKATVSFPGLEQFSGSALTFRHVLLKLIPVFRLTALSLLIVALARPQKTESFEEVSTEGIDIVLAIDISGSMLAEDFVPNRLEASKNVATEFISGRPYDRIGLVVFSGESFTQCPVTTDHAVLINLLREVKSGIIEDGTAIGEGLATAVNRLRDSKTKSRVIILLTDGVNNRGMIAPLTAAGIAKSFGIRVYTIGVGTQGTARAPVMTPYGPDMAMMPVEIDETILRQISDMTDAGYFRATDNDKLLQVYNEIDKLEKSRIDVRQMKIREEKFLIPLSVALVLAALELISRLLFLRNLT